MTHNDREKLCNIGRTAQKQQRPDTVITAPPDSYKKDDHLIHIVNPGQVRMMQAAHIDRYVNNNKSSSATDWQPVKSA